MNKPTELSVGERNEYKTTVTTSDKDKPLRDLIDELLKNTNDSNQADIAKFFMHKDTRMSEKQGFCYHFSPNKKLWKLFRYDEIYTDYMKGVLQSTYKSYLGVLRQLADDTTNKINNTNDEKEKESLEKKANRINLDIKKLSNIYNEVGNDRTQKRIWSQLRPKLDLDDFIEKLNKQRGVLPVKGGLLIDLKTGKDRERTVEDKFTIECNVQYKIASEKTKKDFKELLSNILFIPRVMNDKYTYEHKEDDKEGNNKRYAEAKEKHIEFIQTIFGYILTGENIEKKYFLHYSDGDSGKSLLFGIFEAILSGFSFANNEVLTNMKTTGPRPDLISSKHCRMLYASELPKGAQFAWPVIKNISGNDTIGPRGLHDNNYEQLELRMVINIVTNFVPVFPKDQAVYNRTRVIKYHSKFIECDDDQQFEAKKKELNEQGYENVLRANKLLLTEYKESEEMKSAMLDWCVDGAIKWYQNKGLKYPSYIMEELEKVYYMYQEPSKADDNYYDDFFETYFERNEEVNSSKPIFVNFVHELYKHWINSNNYDVKIPGIAQLGRDLVQKFRYLELKNYSNKPVLKRLKFRETQKEISDLHETYVKDKKKPKFSIILSF